MGRSENMEKERDYHKDREIRATARIEELKKKLEIEVHKLERREEGRMKRKLTCKYGKK